MSARRTFSEESYRGGFALSFCCAASDVEVVYSDMQLEAKCDGKELFGLDPPFTKDLKGICVLASTAMSIWHE